MKNAWIISWLMAFVATFSTITAQESEWILVWNDEFDYIGPPDSTLWNYERGFVRNQELQWYQPENAYCRNGVLTIVAQKERRYNPTYEEGSIHWAKSRRQIEYTSASIHTRGKREFQYGRVEVRARIPVGGGAWPAIWTLGTRMSWPSNGEIDIMEFYRIENVPHILANVAWGTDEPNQAKWDTKAIPYALFLGRDQFWATQFHIWRMDWDEKSIRLYLDEELLNETLLRNTINGQIGERTNPFKQPHYLLLNLAIGGTNGGDPDPNAYPMLYEVDYVKVYQKK